MVAALWKNTKSRIILLQCDRIVSLGLTPVVPNNTTAYDSDCYRCFFFVVGQGGGHNHSLVVTVLLGRKNLLAGSG